MSRGELQKEYGDKKYISATAELCADDEKCWKEILPTKADIAGFIQGYAAVQKRIDGTAIGATLKKDGYENAELMVSEIGVGGGGFQCCWTTALVKVTVS